MRTRGWWLLLGLAGCDSSYTQVGPPPGGLDTGNDGPDGWACDHRDFDGTCLRATGDGWDRPSVESGCNGEVKDGACPTPNLGSCVRDVDLPLEFADVYYAGAFYGEDDRSFLRADCELNFGIWRP